MSRYLPEATFTPIYNHYKEPLTEVKDGYGYLGTLATNDGGSHVQCHICGVWVKSLGIHANFAHQINSKEYKFRFGLGSKTSLNASETRNLAIKIAIKRRAAEPLRKRNFPPPKNKGGRKKSLEWRNKTGRCPDQLLDKINKFAEELGRTPSRREFIRHYKGYMGSINTVFGSYNNAVKHLDLPVNSAGSKPWYTPEQLLLFLINFKEQHGREPSWSDARSGLLPSTEVYRRRFGSWSKAKDEAYGLREVAV